MFKDTEKELRRLEAELLAQDEPEEEYEEEYEEAVDVDALDDDLLNDRELNALLEDTQIFGNAGSYQNHANNYGEQSFPNARIYNSDQLDKAPEELAEDLLEEPREKGVTALAVTACILAVGILCVAVWWFARYRGIF